MPTSQRNLLCPCGSGKKFKRCCELGFTVADQQSTLTALGRLTEGLPSNDQDRLWNCFYGPQGRPPGQSREEDEAFLDWVYFDAITANGDCLVDRILRQPRVSRGARTYAFLMRKTAMRLYEIVDTGEGAHLTLRDILDNVTITLPKEGLKGHDTHHFIAARVCPRGATGHPEIHGPIFLFHAHLRFTLTDRLRAGLAAFHDAHPEASAGTLYKALAPLLHQCWAAAYAPTPLRPDTRDDKAREDDELRLQQSFDGWIDTPIEQLGGVTPRSAVSSPELVHQLIDILRGLETQYERCLSVDLPAFDPTLLWDELGLGEMRHGSHNHPPALGHEVIAEMVPGVLPLVHELIARYGSRPENNDVERILPQSLIFTDTSVRALVRDRARSRALENVDLDAIDNECSDLVAHIWLRCNFEIHLRKVFWVADPLSWMLGTTALDGVSGKALRVPFASIALVYTDRYALGLAERLLAQSPRCPIRGKMLRVLTVYVNEFSLPDDRRRLFIAFTCDAQNGAWPVLVGRDFVVDPDVSVVDILTSEVPGVDANELSPIFSCIPMRHLLHLVLNTILCVTHTRMGESASPPPSGHRSGVQSLPKWSSEEIYDLPGTIDISLLRAIRRARRGAVSREQLHRCLVRGYYRRASPNWKDQEDRWVKPYWRGPTDGPIVERQYRVLP